MAIKYVSSGNSEFDAQALEYLRKLENGDRSAQQFRDQAAADSAVAQADKLSLQVKDLEYADKRKAELNAIIQAKWGENDQAERDELGQIYEKYGVTGDTLAATRLAATQARQRSTKLSATAKAKYAEDFEAKSVFDSNNTDQDYLHANRTSEDNYMTDEEKAVYNYIYATEGAEKAQSFLDALADELNQRQGQAKADKAEGNFLKQMGVKALAGFDQFGSGVATLFGDGEVKTPSATQYASAAVDEDLAGVDLKWYDFAQGEWIDQKIFGRSLGQMAGDAVQTTANMLPSIAASALVGIVDPTAGAWVGSILMGSSAAGNAYQDMLNQGYSQGSAASYGVLAGLSEMLLEKALGGITALGGGSLSKAVTGKLAKLDGVLKKFAQSAGGQVLLNAGSEAMEEGLQSVLEPYFKLIVAGEDFTVDMEEVLYSALMGFVTGGVFEGVPAVKNKIASGVEAKRNDKAEVAADAPQQAAPQPSAAGLPGVGKDAPVIQTPGAEPSAPSQAATQAATSSNPMIDDLINALPGASAEATPAQSQTRQDLQEIIDAQLFPAQNTPAPIDTTQNTDYDNINEPQGGRIYEQTDTGSAHSERSLGANNEFAGVQAESRGASFEDIRQRSLYTDENETVRTRLSAVLAGELERRGYRHGNADGLHLTSGRGQAFEILTVDASTFHDVFEVARKYTRNGELVDLHSVETTEDGIGYEDCENYLSADGMSGFSITPDGDLISVFNADASKKGFLRAIAPVVKSKVKTLDCYMSQHQPLHEIYEKVFGMKVASVMDHNMDYDRDGIAANHNRPKVAFMVNTDRTVEPAFFGKDDYDAAKAYRDSLLDDGPTDLTTQPPSGPTDIGPAMPHAPGGSKVSKLHSNTYANATGEAVQGIGRRAQELDPNIARYDPITEKETFDQAIHRANSPEARTAEIEGLLGKDGWTAADNDTAYIILDKLRQEGDTVNFAALADKQRKMNTTGGQLIQSNAKYTRENLTRRTIDAINTLSDLTERDVPRKFWKDGGFGAWKKEVSRTILDISNKLEQAAENGSAEDIKQIIRSLAQFRRTTARFGTSSNLTKVAEKGLNYIDADTAKAMAMAQLSQIPEDFRKRPMGQVAETIRVHNMLAALTTVNRNLFGNGVIGLVDATSDSTAGRWADILLSKLTGKRTVGNDLAQGKAYLDAAAKSATMAALCVELDIPMDSDSRFTEGTTRTFSPQGGPVTRFLGAYEKAMKYALEVTDQFFSGGTAGAVDQSLQSLSDKAGLTDEERAGLARQTGLRRTFKEDRMLSKATAGVKKGLNQIGKGHLGLGNAVMPFARTGSNVTQTGADYTGAGLVIGLKEVIQLHNDLKNGKYKNGEKIIYAKDGKTVKERISLAQAQRRAATNIGRGITGVGTVALFTAAALCGVLKVHNDEDKDANALDQSGNLSGAQLNLSALLRSLTGESADWQPDDWVISMDFLEPFNSQMYLGYALSKEDGLADILKAYPEASISSIWQSVLDMPMMQGLSDVVGLAESDDPADAAGQLIGNQATGFIPSWMRQTAQWVDPYYRDTAGSNVWEKAGNQIISRIPFLSQTLPEKVDGLGREQIRHDGDFMGFLNTFVNPGQIKQIRTGELEAFIEGVAQASGEMGVYPNSVIPAQLTYRDEDGEKQVYPLQGQDREIYQKAYGETVTEVYTDLMDMEHFSTMSPEDQAAVLKNALSYATAMARSAVVDYSDLPKYIANRPEGMSEAEAILRHTLIGSSTAYADLPIRTAAYVDALVDAITPETKADGTAYTNVRPIQKMEAVVADDRLDAYADALLREYLEEGAERRYDAALTAGFTDDQFVAAYRQYLDTEGENKQQSVIRYIQWEMGMSYASAKKLYTILASRTTSD